MDARTRSRSPRRIPRIPQIPDFDLLYAQVQVRHVSGFALGSFELLQGSSAGTLYRMVAQRLSAQSTPVVESYCIRLLHPSLGIISPAQTFNDWGVNAITTVMMSAKDANSELARDFEAHRGRLSELSDANATSVSFWMDLQRTIFQYFCVDAQGAPGGQIVCLSRRHRTPYYCNLCSGIASPMPWRIPAGPPPATPLPALLG